MDDRYSNDKISPLTPTRPFSFQISTPEERNSFVPSAEFSEVSLQDTDDISENNSSRKLLSDVPDRGGGASSHRRGRSDSTLVETDDCSVSPSCNGEEEEIPRNWPSDPQLVKKLDYHKISEMAAHLFLAFAASSILVFALLSTTVNNTYPQSTERYIPGKPVPVLHPKTTPIPKSTSEDLFPRMEGTSLNSRLKFWADLGPTIIPIIFSAIVTSSLRLLAKLKAQRGTHLGTLELLFGSSSFSNTLRMMFTLRLYIPLNICLLILWSLSPLAGQASLRVLTTRNVTNASRHFSWSVASTKNESFWGNSTRVAHRSPLLASLYLHAMPRKVSPDADFIGSNLDAYKYPLVPMSDPNVSWNSSHFHSVRASRNVTYYAAKGVPIYGPLHSPSSQMRFNVQSNLTFPISLFSFSCANFSTYSRGEPIDRGNRNSQFRAQTGFFTDTSCLLHARNRSSTAPQRIFFGGKNSGTTATITVWECAVVLHTRMLTAKCDQKGKSDVASPLLNAGNQLMQSVVCKITGTSIANVSNDTPLRRSSITSNLFQAWGRIDFEIFGYTTPTVSYLATGSIMQADKPHNISDVDANTFSKRLTMAFNTFWLTAVKPTINTTTATPLFYQPFSVVRYNMFWFVILVVASLLLIVASVLNIWLRYHLYSPDIFGYVSSLTIENPHLRIPGVEPGCGSTLDGLERTRLLKDIIVRIGDVRSGEKFGKLALARYGEGVEEVKRGRRYI